MFSFWENHTRIQAGAEDDQEVEGVQGADAAMFPGGEDAAFLEGDEAIVERVAEEHGMSARQLKKLSRVDLLELMVEQAKYIDELEERLGRAEDQSLAQRVALQQIVTISQASLGIDVDAQTAQEALTQYASELEKVRQGEPEPEHDSEFSQLEQKAANARHAAHSHTSQGVH